MTDQRIINDPQLGDVVRRGDKTRTVTGRDAGNVYYRTESGHEKCCWITTWRKWCLKEDGK